MKTNKILKSSLSAITILVATATSHSATLLQGEFQAIGDTNTSPLSTNPGISVTSGQEGYSTGRDGLGTGGLDGSFNNSILDYAFYTSGTGSVVESFGGAASLIGTLSSSGTSTDVGGMSLWAGSNTAGAVDQSTWARPGVVSGTVDISGLDSGSLYMFFGTRVGSGDPYDISFSITGTGPVVPVLEELNVNNTSLGGTGIQNNTWFVYRADFADAADYDTLTYTYAGDNTSAARSRFAGTVLTGVVPEPSSTALLGLGGLAFLLRRRR